MHPNIKIIAGFSLTIFPLKSVKFYSPENMKKIAYTTQLPTLVVPVTHSNCHSLFMHPSIQLPHYKLHNLPSGNSIQLSIDSNSGWNSTLLKKKYKNNINAPKDQHSWYCTFCVLYFTVLFKSSDYKESITWWIVKWSECEQEPSWHDQGTIFASAWRVWEKISARAAKTIQSRHFQCCSVLHKFPYI